GIPVLLVLRDRREPETCRDRRVFYLAIGVQDVLIRLGGVGDQLLGVAQVQRGLCDGAGDFREHRGGPAQVAARDQRLGGDDSVIALGGGVLNGVGGFAERLPAAHGDVARRRQQRHLHHLRGAKLLDHVAGDGETVLGGGGGLGVGADPVADQDRHHQH